MVARHRSDEHDATVTLEPVAFDRHASLALRLLLERLRKQKKGPLAGLCTSIENAVAIRCFEKAGFRKLRQYDDPTYSRCWVLVVDL